MLRTGAVRGSIACLGLLASWMIVPPTWGAPAKSPRPIDSDGDGLSDFDEIHKYRTNPSSPDSDGDGTPDGAWDERREYTYSIRCLVNHLAPAHAVSDVWQDAREVHRDGDYVELEIVAYPLATPDSTTRGADTPGEAPLPDALSDYVLPNLTNDFDAETSAKLRRDLSDAGIAPSAVGDVAAWAMKRVKQGGTGFTIPYVTARDGVLSIHAGCEAAAIRDRSDSARTLEEQLDIEVRGRSMFLKARCGACTSTAVYLQSILRALGIPTRTTITMPPIDSADEQQRRMLAEGLRPSRLRDQIMRGALRGQGAWVEHTINTVWVQGRWRRLNYARLGQPIVDERYCGLMLRILDYDDRATAGTARTWGRRWAQGDRSARWPNRNPYALLAISDRLGAHAKVTLPPSDVKPTRMHKKLTVLRAAWSAPPSKDYALITLDCKEWFPEQDGDQYKRFTQGADPTFVLESAGRASIRALVGIGSVTGADSHGVSLILQRRAYDAMSPGVPYRLVPVNGRQKLRWVIQGNVTITRR